MTHHDDAAVEKLAREIQRSQYPNFLHPPTWEGLPDHEKYGYCSIARFVLDRERVAREALEFYANHEMYRKYNIPISASCIVLTKAREALKKLGGG